VVKCGVPQPLNELDDLDPKEYALRVVVPRWLGGFEDRVRCALGRVGFLIERLIIKPDDSMATFWVRPAAERLRVPRNDRWSSYRAYVGLVASPGCG
jgi:hypothetical protein